MKYIRHTFLLTIGICITSLLFAQTAANGSAPVSGNTPGTSGLNSVKPATTNSKKVKTVDKKKRKATQITTVKKATSTNPKNVK